MKVFMPLILVLIFLLPRVGGASESQIENFVGVWTYSLNSFKDAKVSTKAYRFLANGEYEIGVYNRKEKKFSKEQRTTKDVNTYIVEGNSITYIQSGERKLANFHWDDKRRFQTLNMGYEKPYVIYFYKQK